MEGRNKISNQNDFTWGKIFICKKYFLFNVKILTFLNVLKLFEIMFILTLLSLLFMLYMLTICIGL